MKSSLLISGLVLTASQALAAITVITPWSTSVWTAGGTGEITWNVTAPESTLNCDIQLLNGDTANQNLVAQITSTSTPIACSAGKYGIYPINDFASGQYSIRIGQSATNNWYYSGLFTFNGTGTSKPISVVSSATAISGTAAAAAAATSGAIPIGKAAASGSAAAVSASATTVSSDAHSVTFHSAAVALGAVAAAAFAL
ncbi:unnamed protein product [Rhizopus stolonifer]